MKDIDVVVVGELNVDVILNGIGSFPAVGKEILANEMAVTLGSSSAIFASNLSRLGARVAFIGKVGKDDFGRLVIDSLEASGVDTSMILRSDTLATGATIVLNYKDDRAMVTHPGAMSDLAFEDIPFEALSRAGHLHFSSFFLQPGLRGDVGRMFYEARKLGLTTSFDAQWDPCEEWNIDLRAVLPQVDVFLPNEMELMKLTGTLGIWAAIEAVEDIANMVVVKRGSEGSVSWHKGKLLHKDAYLNEQVVDAIGAGDSFNAGFIYRWLQRRPLEECQDFGNLAGAISTTAEGGTGAFTSSQAIMKVAKERFGYVE